MHPLTPTTLEAATVRLEPLALEHEPALRLAVQDGRLWELWYTSVPESDHVRQYIEAALDAQRRGIGLPWVVRDLVSDTIIGMTQFHDVESRIDRVHIGYTWYAKRWQRTHVNTTCKLLLMTHAFDALDARVVVLRTDSFNFASQRAIAALGAHKDGVLRHHQMRRDGTVRDSVIYSILHSEWPNVKRHLLTRLARNQRN